MEMRSNEEHKLTTSIRAALARSISRESVEAFAAEHLGFDDATIENIRDEANGKSEAFNRKIFEVWANKNAGDNQKQVRISNYVAYLELLFALWGQQ